MTLVMQGHQPPQLANDFNRNNEGIGWADCDAPEPAKSRQQRVNTPLQLKTEDATVAVDTHYSLVQLPEILVDYTARSLHDYRLSVKCRSFQ